MRFRILGLFLVALLLVSTRTAAAQPAQPSAAAALLARYAGASFVPEVTNEDYVRESPDYAAAVKGNGRLTGIVLRTRTGNLVVELDLFRSAGGAAGFLRNYPLPFVVEAAPDQPAPSVGEQSRVFRVRGRQDTGDGSSILLVQRDRVVVSVSGPSTIEGTANALALAQQIDQRVATAPPPAPGAAEAALDEEPTPTVLVRGAVRTLLDRFIDSLGPDRLFTEAWQGASAALRQAGVADVPSPPAYPADEEAAVALHMSQFPALERLAAGRLDPRLLAYAAINELARQRNDCHTSFLSPEQWAAFRVALLNEERVAIGVAFSLESPLRIVRVLPGSPAATAGLRRGQTVVAINGQPVAGLTTVEARQLIDRREGAPTSFTVQNPSGRVETLTAAPGRFREPPLEVAILPGNIGLLRFYTFQSSNEQLELMRRALTEFEARGVQGWMVDLRQNEGGDSALSVAMMSLFVESGRLSARSTRGQEPVFTSASGDALSFQRPLVFLVGPGSASAGEIMPGALQARGRAIVVGEQTAGCIGSFRPAGLLDGSSFHVTETEVLIGPDGQRLHRVGVTPNVVVPAPTPEDEEAGRDPQLDAAVDVLRELIGTPVSAMPAPGPAGYSAVVVDF